MKYFFLSDGWSVGRVWAESGLWQEAAWRRAPDIQRLNVCLTENEVFWLYRVEDAVLTVEVKLIPSENVAFDTKVIGQVVLKRLIAAEKVIEKLSKSEAVCEIKNIHAVVQ
jgi:hypothetical protein